MSDKITVRKWKALEYLDPHKYLCGLRDVYLFSKQENLPALEPYLRFKSFRGHKEVRDAAIFCYGMSEVFMKTTVAFSMVEDSDYDFVTYAKLGGNDVFVPVQAKELTPIEINDKSLQEELNKLIKYVDSSDLVVSYLLNRAMTVNFSKLNLSHLPVAAIYFYGALGDGSDRWFISGLRNGKICYGTFNLPVA